MALELGSNELTGLIVATSAAGSYGTTMIAKSLWRGWLLSRQREEPWFHDAALRVASCLSGGVLGWLSMPSLQGVGLGLAAGAVNTFLVRQVKQYLRRKVEG